MLTKCGKVGECGSIFFRPFWNCTFSVVDSGAFLDRKTVEWLLASNVPE